MLMLTRCWWYIVGFLVFLSARCRWYAVDSLMIMLTRCRRYAVDFLMFMLTNSWWCAVGFLMCMLTCCWCYHVYGCALLMLGCWLPYVCVNTLLGASNKRCVARTPLDAIHAKKLKNVQVLAAATLHRKPGLQQILDSIPGAACLVRVLPSSLQSCTPSVAPVRWWKSFLHVFLRGTFI